MFLGILLMCQNSAESLDVYHCWPVTSPYLYETEEQCQLAIHGYLASPQGILTLLEGEPQEIVCFEFATGQNQGA